MADIDLSGLSVALMMNARHELDTTVPTLNSIVGTINLLHDYGVKNEWFCRTGGDLNCARNMMAEKLLQSEHNRAFLIDSDIVWRPEDFLRLLAFSLRYSLIGACYRMKSDPPFFITHIDPVGVTADEYGCIPVTMLGLGFVCIQREVFEKASGKAPLYTHVQHPKLFPEIFRFDKVGDAFRGEDAAFLSDVRELGYTPMMDPSIELGHVGIKEFRGRFSDVLKRERVAA